MDFIYQVHHVKISFVSKQGLAKPSPHCSAQPLPSALQPRLLGERDPLVLHLGKPPGRFRVGRASADSRCAVRSASLPHSVRSPATKTRGWFALTRRTHVGFITAAFQPGKSPSREITFHCSPVVAPQSVFPLQHVNFFLSHLRKITEEVVPSSPNGQEMNKSP